MQSQPEIERIVLQKREVENTGRGGGNVMSCKAKNCDRCKKKARTKKKKRGGGFLRVRIQSRITLANWSKLGQLAWLVEPRQGRRAAG